MKTAKRSIYFTGKQELELHEAPIPEPKLGELLIETTRTLVSTGTELICYTRNFAPGTHWHAWVQYPFPVGYSNVGRVIGLGDGVTGWNVGDRVATRGGHTSHLTVRADLAVHVPGEVPDEDATWMSLGKITQVGVRAAPHALGDSVVLIGMGPLGQLVTQYVRLMGADQIIAIDTVPRRLEMAMAHGATDALAMTAADALDEVKRLTHDRRADIVYDITGHPSVFATALPLARKFGTVVLLGDTGNPQQQTLTNDIITRGVRVVGAHDTHPTPLQNELARWSGKEMMELFLRYLARGQIRVSDLITHRYRPEQAKEMYDSLVREREKAMGVVIEWEKGKDEL